MNLIDKTDMVLNNTINDNEIKNTNEEDNLFNERCEY